VHARELLLDTLLRVRDSLPDPGDVQVDSAVRTASPLLDLAHDAARHVIAREQVRGTPRIAVPLRVPPPLLLVVGGLCAVILRDVVEHEASAILVEEDASLAAHPLGHQDSLAAR